ncbi:MAG TPA: hypothetical protein VMF35_12700 [Acidimicrobiales bacterium]|nr:hypothetical protein [Acidimicrobiales bacterium]
MSPDVRTDSDSPAFMSALVTEHFALQSVSSATISESGSRAALYLSALSSGLVAIGFASSSRRSLAALSFSVLPTIFILGWFTVVRLIETSVENIVCRRRIESIRRYYADLDPEDRGYFAPDYSGSGLHGVHYRGRSILFTMASMILLVNSVLGGATVALACILGAHWTAEIGVPVGVAFGIGILVVGLLYEYRRLQPFISGHAVDATDRDLT